MRYRVLAVAERVARHVQFRTDMRTDTTRLTVILACALAFATAGCDLVAEEELLEDDLGSVEQPACSTYYCGGWKNGIRQAVWNHIAGGAVRPNELSKYGAGTWSGPRSICEGWLKGGACVVREGWIRWATNDYTDGFVRDLRTAAFHKMLEVIGEPGQLYYDRIELNNNLFLLEPEGQWGIAPHALGSNWSYTDMELITGALILMLNENGVHIEVALRAEGVPVPAEQPDPEGFLYEEAAAYGNIFKYWHTGISGGYDAPNPARDARFAKMNPSSAADVFVRGDKRCDYSSHGIRDHRRMAQRCYDQYDRVWEHPVVARVRTRPVGDDDWYLPGPVTVTEIGGGTKKSF